MSTIQASDLLYEGTRKITEMTEYGVSFQALMAEKVGPPPEGARFDVAFEGAASGPKLKGAATGVDYLRVRADGCFDLHIRETIIADTARRLMFRAMVSPFRE
jgi:hypothetical protein